MSLTKEKELAIAASVGGSNNPVEWLMELARLVQEIGVEKATQIMKKYFENQPLSADLLSEFRDIFRKPQPQRKNGFGSNRQMRTTNQFHEDTSPQKSPTKEISASESQILKQQVIN